MDEGGDGEQTSPVQEETENPRLGTTEETIPPETVTETVVPESTITDTILGDTVTSAAGDDITTATQPDIQTELQSEAPPESAREKPAEAEDTSADTVADAVADRVTETQADPQAGHAGDTTDNQNEEHVGHDDQAENHTRGKEGVVLVEPPRPYPSLQPLVQTPRRVPSQRRGIVSQASSRPSVGALPSLAPSQAEIGRIPSAGRDRRDVQTPRISRESTRLRNVPNVVKMATVTAAASAKTRPETPVEFYQSGYYGEGVRRLRKVVSWDQANNARPPLRVDMDGPTPWSYSPMVKPLKETNAPAWSFGKRSFVEKKGGSRKSWEKSWFHTDDVWKMKTDFVDEVV